MHAELPMDLYLPPGTEVDRYVIQQLVGEGGTAVVYRIHHPVLDAQYALKLLHRHTPSLKRRLLEEAKMQSRLHHPNIVQVLDVIEVDGQLGMVMEYVDGPSLECVLEHRRLELVEVDRLVEQIFTGVARAHRLGVVHRDLKPANILLAPEGGRLVAKVCDFGLAKSLRSGRDSATQSGCTMGTPLYMSPEQVRDAKRVDERSDVFTLGAIVYEMLSGVHPFRGGTDALSTLQTVANAHYVPLEDVVPHLPTRMLRAVSSALQVDPDERCSSVEQLRAIWLGDSQQFAFGWEEDLVRIAEELSPSRRDGFGGTPSTVSPSAAQHASSVAESPLGPSAGALYAAAFAGGLVPVTLALALLTWWSWV